MLPAVWSTRALVATAWSVGSKEARAASATLNIYISATGSAARSVQAIAPTCCARRWADDSVRLKTEGTL